MLGLSATYNYFLSYGRVDMRKGCFSLSQLVREEMGENPLDGNNVYIFLAKNLKVVKILHYERGFFVLYEKRPLQGRFKKPLFDTVSQKYQISWSDMVCFTESVVISSMRISNAT
ncbi:MAG: IS66 family insertion sequence element accessory protein TnpB [Phocaeicola sp.]